MQSPVKQKVQAFEKHAVQAPTPEKYKSQPGKYVSLLKGFFLSIFNISLKISEVSLIFFDFFFHFCKIKNSKSRAH